MKITSPAFNNNGTIPIVYTCDGSNVNPPLTISNVPSETKSLVLICSDPDAPSGDWIHWLVWNIKPATAEIEENSLPEDAVEGTTSFSEVGYRGPCPPSGTHRYFFKIYALDTELNLSLETKTAEVIKKITGHILDQAELIGLYGR